MTTTDIATRNESAITTLPPSQQPSTAARQMLLAHAEMMQTAFELADNLVRTTMVPTRFRGKAQDATAAILYGAEIGLNPIQSLQRVIPIHGMPSIEARTMVALLKARGYRFNVVEQSDTSVTIEGFAPSGEQATSTWTIERARRAGYVPEPSSPESLRRPTVDDDWVTVTKTWEGKSRKSVLGNMKYITDPQTMLKAKGYAEVSRDLAPDILMGISYTSEELESERWDGTVSVEPPQRGASAPVTADEILGDPEPAPAKPKRKPRAKAEPAPEPQDAEVVEESTDNEPEPAPAEDESDQADATPEAVAESPADAPTSDLRKSARGKLTGAIFSMFGDVGLSKEENREDRLVVIEAIVGRPVASSNELTDDELQNLRNGLYSRQQAGTLDADINDWLNLAAIKEADAAEAAANSTTTEGNN